MTLSRKPFLLQMFGSIANHLENSTSSFHDPFKIPPTALYKLILSLEENTTDVINVLELVKMKNASLDHEIFVYTYFNFLPKVEYHYGLWIYNADRNIWWSLSKSRDLP